MDGTQWIQLRLGYMGMVLVWYNYPAIITNIVSTLPIYDIKLPFQVSV
jgi:hypothetical protein